MEFFDVSLASECRDIGKGEALEIAIETLSVLLIVAVEKFAEFDAN
jgi:hypothetical protein